MKYEIYSIYDKVADECGPIFQAKNFGVASRYVKEMSNNDKVKLDEYYLCFLGYFDSDGGTIWPENVQKWRLDEIDSVLPLFESSQEVNE